MAGARAGCTIPLRPCIQTALRRYSLRARAILGGIAFTLALTACGFAGSANHGPADAVPQTPREDKVTAVSYTHLTLPTIYSV